MIWDVDTSQKVEPPSLGRRLFLAASRGVVEGVKDLVAGAVDAGSLEVACFEQVNGQNAFHAACKKGHVDCVEELLKVGVGVELSETADGRSGWLLAAFEGRLAVAQLLLKTLPKTNQGVHNEDRDGNTVLHYACWGGHLDVVSMLLEAFPDDPIVSVDRRNNEGMTAMQFASAGNHVEISKLLFSHARQTGKEDPAKQRSETGYTPIHKACQYGSMDTIKLLLDSRDAAGEAIAIEVNCRSENGTTPLHLAIQHGHLPIVELLVRNYDADFNAQTGHGLTPLHYAALGAHVEISHYLMSLPGVNVNLLSISGAHALHLAASVGSLPICEELVVGHGVDPFALDSEGKSPIDAALGSGFKELASMLAGWSAIRLRTQKLTQLVRHPPKPAFKVVFCGMGHFESGFLLTKQALSGDDDVVVLQCTREEAPSQIRGAHVIVPLMTRITADLIQQAPKLQLVNQFGVGLEGVDVAACTAAGVRVCKIPSEGCGNAESCAEHAIFLALSVLRNAKGLALSVLRGKLGYPTGATLLGATALIVGYGGLGRQLVQRLVAFGMKAIHVAKRTAQTAAEAAEDPLVSSGRVRVDTLDAVLASSPSSAAGLHPARTASIIFLTCNLTEENRGMVDTKFLHSFPPGLVLVNVARGGLVEHSDLRDALETGQVRGAGLDVYHTEPFPLPAEDSLGLLSHPRVTATPHVAGVTEVSYQTMADTVARNVRLLREGGGSSARIPGQVNL